MSEPGPDSVPTSADPRSKRPVKKRALTPLSQHASSIDALFAQPEKQIKLAPSSRISSNDPSSTTSSSALSRLAPPPDIVTNVQGSSAGAGSGEFHVYKASRRREYERIRLMEEETAKEEADREWEARQREVKAKVEAKTSKNKAKRDKARARKDAAKNGETGGSGNSNAVHAGGGGNKNGAVNGHAQKQLEKKLGPHKAAIPVQDDEDEGEQNPSVGNLQVKAVEEIGIVIHDEE